MMPEDTLVRIERLVGGKVETGLPPGWGWVKIAGELCREVRHQRGVIAIAHQRYDAAQEAYQALLDEMRCLRADNLALLQENKILAGEE